MRYAYFEWDDRFWQYLLDHRQLSRLFRYLVTVTAGDVEEALEILRELQRRGMLPPGADLERFRRQLEENEEIDVDAEGNISLTPHGERGLRKAALDQVFGRLQKRGIGDHPVPREGRGGGEATENRAWRFGDEVSHVDFRASFHNAFRRAGLQNWTLREEDLEVRETEHLATCATVLLIDISHSMILYGEDRITPAKQVALALIELIQTRYPKDSVDVAVFGDEAWPIPLQQVPYVQVGPFHTNTRAALQVARRILHRKKHANKQVILITDGKPTVVTDEEGVVYRNTFGLDPKIMNKTFDQAIALRREGVPITTFMIASDPYLQQFVHRLTELNHGKAYFSEPGKLGQFVLVDFVRNRRRRVR
jgi:Ca-activated chloride channel family protein